MVSTRGTIARTATQSGSRSGDTVGDSSPGVIACARSSRLARQVVVDEHVLARDEHTLQATLQRRYAGALRLGADEHGRRVEDDRADDLEALGAQGRPGLDDVGDGIRDAQPGRDSTAPSSFTMRASTPCWRGSRRRARVARRDAQAREIAELGDRAGRCREAEGGVTEVERLRSRRRPIPSRAAGRGR